MNAISAPADRRFRRAHVKPARRRSPWRTALFTAIKCAAIVLLALYAAYRGSRFMGHAPFLAIDRIVVDGNGRMSQADVLAALDGLRGENIVLVDLPTWRARLVAAPWVHDASFRRTLPSTVEVSIDEREPIGIGRIKTALYLIDRDGVVIDEYGPKYSDLDLPIIDGLQVSGAAGGGTADAERARLAARLIADLQPRQTLAGRLSQIDVSDARNVGVILTGDPAVLYVGADSFLPRLQRYTELAAALRERVPEIDYVDLRFDDRIYVRPAGRKGSPAVAVRR